ncbi:ectonucleoside triphosphate diphosphohydrolase 8-like [Ambystoma mexicanum]|uniref:ectonucleoside triphosphate diphosphohydrolase 8-like n=1 Tax=Ambystoma mexicanum TaxID=8296 RepID=UPI0037E94F1E
MVTDSKQNTLLGLVVVTVISMVIALILSFVGITKVLLPPKLKYGMVLDAGSTHTALFLYQWPTDKENDTGVVSQRHTCLVTGPGISSYANDPELAGESLRKCIDEAMDLIPSQHHLETPAYLGATAGMRLLRRQDPAAADRILEEVSKTLQEYRLNFRGARILTGVEEGAYGWVTINYLLHSFMTYSFKGVWVRPAKTDLFGALDLGGASTQISFIPNVDMEDKRDEVKFRLYGVNYTIYTHSYLCYGLRQALKLLHLQAVVGKDLRNQVVNPCYPAGYQEVVPVTSLYDSPCTEHLAPSHDKPIPGQNITFVGSGDAKNCHILFTQIFDFSSCGKKPMCTFDGVYQPPVTGKYFAFAAFYYMFDFLNLTSGQSLQDVHDKIKEFCSTPWIELKRSYPHEAEERLRDYCGGSNYVLTLLQDVYEFTENQWHNIFFQKQASNTDIGWTLGYMLNLTNMIPAEAALRVHGQDFNIWIAAICFIALALAFGVAMLWIYMRD